MRSDDFVCDQTGASIRALAVPVGVRVQVFLAPGADDLTPEAWATLSPFLARLLVDTARKPPCTIELAAAEFDRFVTVDVAGLQPAIDDPGALEPSAIDRIAADHAAARREVSRLATEVARLESVIDRASPAKR